LLGDLVQVTGRLLFAGWNMGEGMEIIWASSLILRHPQQGKGRLMAQSEPMGRGALSGVRTAASSMAKIMTTSSSKNRELSCSSLLLFNQAFIRKYTNMI
jgi:hypothetical protein